MPKIVDRLSVPALTLSALALIKYVRPKRSLISKQSGTQDIMNMTLPSFTLRLLDSSGASVPLPVHGSPNLVYFMSTTCPACAKNEARWDALRDSVRGVAVAVAASTENMAVLRGYWSIRRPDYPVGMLAVEGQDSIIDAYRMQATPMLYLFDSAGVLRGSWIGVFGDTITHHVANAVRALRIDK